ncbi:MAG TPA: Gfo/Idh/MocA family oxidoreductase [Tepidisphaeraceae bacterium]|nr:Gfo/Idh/MocA family oxidoreductase [Tepidisphaeraceae bacterium]
MTIRWGIIGCGDVTEVKSGPGFQKTEGSELVAVMRRTGSLAQDYARRHGVPKWYGNADALINDSQVDAIYVATPPGSHLEYALKIAAAGKACHMEKPMARSFAECRQMVDAFARAKRPIFVAYYRRAQPRFVKLKELIDSGRIGRITGCRYRMTKFYMADPKPEWRLDAEQSGGGLLLDVGSHAIDIMDFLLGEFVEFSGTAHTTGATKVEDNVSLSFRTNTGVIGSASWNFAGPTKDEIFEIEGTQGKITTQILQHSPLVIQAGEKTETLEFPDLQHVAQPLIKQVVDDLLGKGKCSSTGQAGARASKVMDAALSSFYNGRDDEFWKRPQTWRK